MTLLSPLTSTSASLSHLSADIAGPSTGRDRDPAVRPLERVQGLRDSLRDRTGGGRYQRPETPRPEDRSQRPRGSAVTAVGPRRDHISKDRLPALGEDNVRPESAPASAAFLVQVFGQDLGQTQAFVPEHRDAADLVSEAYRRAGATPPVYTEQPTLFSFAI